MILEMRCPPLDTRSMHSQAASAVVAVWPFASSVELLTPLRTVAGLFQNCCFLLPVINSVMGYFPPNLLTSLFLKWNLTSSKVKMYGDIKEPIFSLFPELRSCSARGSLNLFYYFLGLGCKVGRGGGVALFSHPGHGM